MTRLDTIRIIADYSHITDFDQTHALVDPPREKGRNNEDPYWSANVAKCRSGINRTNITIGGNVELNWSAKILGDNYLKGINKNTFEQAMDTFNQYSPVKLDKYQVYDFAKVKRADTNQNLYPEYSVSDCIDAMMLFRTNLDYAIQPYYTKEKGSGLEVVNNKNKKVIRRAIAYNKHTELSRKVKENKEFLSLCSNGLKLLNDCKGCLRFEVNNIGSKSIKERFKIPMNDLKLVLNSDAPVNYNFIEKVSKGSKQLDLFLDDSRGKSFNDLRKYYGDIGICEMLNRDPELVKAFLRRNMTRTSVYKHLPRYVDFIKQLNEKDKTKANKDFSSTKIMNHILELIKQAA